MPAHTHYLSHTLPPSLLEPSSFWLNLLFLFFSLADIPTLSVSHHTLFFILSLYFYPVCFRDSKIIYFFNIIFNSLFTFLSQSLSHSYAGLCGCKLTGLEYSSSFSVLRIMFYFQLVIMAGTVLLAYYFEYTDTFPVHIQGFFCYDKTFSKPYLGPEESSKVPPVLVYSLVTAIPTITVSALFLFLFLFLSLCAVCMHVGE